MGGESAWRVGFVVSAVADGAKQHFAEVHACCGGQLIGKGLPNAVSERCRPVPRCGLAGDAVAGVANEFPHVRLRPSSKSLDRKRVRVGTCRDERIGCLRQGG